VTDDANQGEDAMRIESATPVDEVMRRWPWTIRAFIQWRMKCVGCPFGVFHGIDYACDEHGVDGEAFLAALVKTITIEEATRESRQPAA
jgi:hybrid cluster-associated redox disulfide protein